MISEKNTHRTEHGFFVVVVIFFPDKHLCLFEVLYFNVLFSKTLVLDQITKTEVSTSENTGFNIYDILKTAFTFLPKSFDHLYLVL